MKKLLFILLLLVSVGAYAQNDTIEVNKANIKGFVEEQRISKNGNPYTTIYIVYENTLYKSNKSTKHMFELAKENNAEVKIYAIRKDGKIKRITALF